MTAEQKELLKKLAQMGEVILISNGSRVHLNENGTVALKTQLDAVLYFLQRLDIDMVSNVLEDNRTYQNFEKPLFIKKLDAALNEFIEAGDTYLNRYKGSCNSKSCNYKCKGYSFVGNNSASYFDLIIDVKDGVINDIYECFSFKCEDERVLKNEYIVVDKSDDPF
ncbi:MAG: hypothetical protein RL308_2560 [Bacteroidota bacterium]|jgi:hypothetical protein